MKIELYKLILIVSCLLLINNFSNAQVNSTQDVSDHHHKPCGTDQHHDYKMQTNPEYKYFYQKQKSMVDSILRNPGDLRSYPPQYTIPVVVHVIHLGESVGTGSNISDTQIQQAIQGLNDRFRNGIGSSLDIEIDFCLATRAPNGSATNGINRVNGSGIPGFSSQGIAFNGNCGANEQAVKDLSKWSPLSYYNIWVVHQICEGWAGYASFPSAQQNDYDGTVMDYDYMTNQSSTLTHELGHGFNLYHTFQGDNGSSCPPNNNCQTDGDQICDTPPHRVDDCGSANPCSGSGNWDNSRYNYMSYCFPSQNLFRFTPNQKARMRATLDVFPRQNLLSSLGCSPPVGSGGVLTMTTNINATPNPVNQGGQMQFSFNVRNTGTSSFTGVISIDLVSLSNDYIEELGITNQFTLTPNQTFTNNLVFNSIINQPPGTYRVLAFYLPAGSTDWQQINDGNFNNEVQITVSSATCSVPTTSEFNHSNVATTTAQLSTTAGGNQFQFRYKLSSGSTWITTSESASTSTSISSLTSGTSYDYQVRRLCTNNVWSNWSVSKSFTTPGSGGVLTMTTNISATPNPINQGGQMQFSFNVRNTGTSSFTGDILIGLYNISGIYLQELGIDQYTLSPNQSFINNLVFNSVINQPTDTYWVFAWYRPTGSDWLQINDGNFSNVVEITVSTATCSAPTTSEFIHSNVTPTTAQLSTTAGGNQFQFRYKLSSGSTWIATSESASTSTSISILNSGTSYDYQLRRRCTNNVWSEWSVTKMFTTTTTNTCPTPTGLAATAPGYSHVLLNWNTVIGGSGYQTRLRTGSQNWNEGQVYSSASVIWYNMIPFTQYEFQVRAQCSSGSFSDWSTSVFITTQGQDDPYCYSYGNSWNDWIAGVAVGTIDNFSTNGYGYTNFTSQTANLQPNGPYYIQLTPGTNDSPEAVYWRVWIDLNGDNDFNDNGEQVFQASGLTSLSVAGNITIPVSASPGLTRMRISMSTGDYPPPCQTGNLLDVEDYSVYIISTCSAPVASEFNHSNVTTTTAQLSTTAGGNQFQFRYKLSSGSTWTTTSESVSTNININSLAASTSYDYQVRRRCTNNVWSNWSVTNMFTTTAATCLMPTGLTISNIGATSFTVSWNEVSGATAYEIQLKQGPDGDWFNIVGNPFGGSPINLSAVPDNIAMQCRVRSICGSNNSPYSNVVSFMTTALPCSAPTSSEFNHSNLTTTTAQMNTTASGNQFQFRYKLSPGSTWTTTSESASTTTSISSLSAGNSYDYQIRRRCTNNVWSDWSATKMFTTTTATCPTPTGLTITNIAATSFTVSWNSVSGSTAYEIQLKQGPTGDWYNIEGNPFGGSPVNVPGVPDNMAMQCRVRSICGSNNSPYTNEVSFMTSALSCSVPTTSEFNHSNVTTTTAQLSTTAVGNLFQFRHKLSSGSIWTTTSESASTSTSISNLTAGTSYDYQVRRRCTNNVWGDWSVSRSFSTNISVQAPIANFSTSTTCGQAPLSVNFSDMSSQAPTSWLWNFGNGQTSTLQNPSITFTIPGTYNITLNVTNEGGTHSLTKTAFVTVVSPVSVNVSSNAVCLGTPVVLTATGADTYTWTGPGLNATTGNSVTAIPPTPGIFYYTVKGTQNGCSGTSKTITIEVMPDNIFSVSLETVGCQSSDIIFKAVTQNGGSTTNILWYRNGQPVWSGPNYTLYSAVNGDKVYCEATLVNPPQCTKSEMAKSEVYTINCLSSIQGIEGLQSAMLIPNPNSGQFNLKLDITLPIKGSIRIINILGQTVYDENVSLNPGVNTIPVHLQSNTPGLYRLILQSGHGLYDKAFEVFR